MASPYFVGDSIAEGLRTTAGGDGDTKVGRSPASVLQTIRQGPNLNGRSVVLSTGLSNNPADTASAAAQFEALRAKGAGDISVVGLGDRFSALNPVVQQFAQHNGAHFAGGFQAGSDGVHPQSYKSVLNMAESAYAPSPIDGTKITVPAPAYSPSPLPATQPTPAYYPPSNLDISKGIIKNESGGRNVVSPQGARGPGQIMPATFRQYALPGENIDNPKDNLAVHNRIISDYERRWPGDPARVAVAYFSGPGNVAPPGSPTPWKRNVSDVNESVSKYVANALGAAGGKGGAPVPSPSPSAPATAPSVGTALASLTKADETGKSPLENLQGMTSQPQQQQASGGNLGAEQASAGTGVQRQAQLAAQGAQLAALLKQQSQQPLSFTSAPYGANAGLQNPAIANQQFGQSMVPMPGTTLTSMGGGLV